MSLSQYRPTNPALRYMKVKNGAVSYYDKESQENVTVPTPLEFIVLDQLATIKGLVWCRWIWLLVQRSSPSRWRHTYGSYVKGYESPRCTQGDIKADPNVAGAKYHTSIYVATKGRDSLEINNLSLTGAALNAWIEFTQKHRINTNKVVLASWADAKKGSVSYKVPVFEAVPMGEAEKDEAVELDKQLQTYLNEYFNYTPDDGHDESSAKQKDVVVEDFGENEPINLDDILSRG